MAQLRADTLTGGGNPIDAARRGQDEFKKVIDGLNTQGDKKTSEKLQQYLDENLTQAIKTNEEEKRVREALLDTTSKIEELTNSLNR